ncbi:hypothetical protein [Ureibacillus aquaedulcis]|uniref:Uncharacterized protein n=1 Tax=Ureibacillus aquaedulcis TaxID=3058421 RepID=A0ABT8GNL3_9BACL|nr:hypothetical protein [Ureibacillus sp. BA0131]MDN4493010.1 hypothetical protein [Ureibacillus sp. BA0131]
MSKEGRIEKVFWSVALPGFGQILNGQFIKGVFFVGLEVLINVQANLNKVIIYSFQGNMKAAIENTNYAWLMFYPCLYMFAIWDAYRYAEGEVSPYIFLPFVFSAYFGTIGVTYSSRLELFGVLLGPVFLPILFLISGICIGFFIKIIVKYVKKALTVSCR